MLAACICHRRPGFLFLQDADGMFLTEPAVLYLVRL